jgi:hypothetical protein
MSTKSELRSIISGDGLNVVDTEGTFGAMVRASANCGSDDAVLASS